MVFILVSESVFLDDERFNKPGAVVEGERTSPRSDERDELVIVAKRCRH